MKPILIVFSYVAAVLLGVYAGSAIERGVKVTPVQITAAPCLEAPKELCLFDATRKREVRVLGDGSVVFYTPAPNATNTEWEVGR